MYHTGDPRRPYPQDIEMRSGWLGRLMEGVPGETEGPGADRSAPQEVVQSSASASQMLQPTGGLGKIEEKLHSREFIFYFCNSISTFVGFIK